MKIAMEEDRDEASLDDIVFDAPDKTSVGIAERIGSRNLLIIIVTMPFVFFVVVMAIIAIFGAPEEEAPAVAYRGAVTPTAPAQEATDALAEPAARVTLPTPAANASLAAANAPSPFGAIALDGDRLAVRVDGETGAAVRIYNLKTNDLIQVVPLSGSDTPVRRPRQTRDDSIPTESVVISIDAASLGEQPNETETRSDRVDAAPPAEEEALEEANLAPLTVPTPSLNPRRADVSADAEEEDEEEPFNPYTAVLPTDAAATEDAAEPAIEVVDQ